MFQHHEEFVDELPDSSHPATNTGRSEPMRGTVTIIDEGNARVHSYLAPDDGLLRLRGRLGR